MTTPSDRKYIIEITQEAHENGARWSKIARTIDISQRTLKRWISQKNKGDIAGDKRPIVEHKKPAYTLSKEEKEYILQICNTAEFASMTPDQIVATLADRGEYIASERSFYRVLKENKQLKHRGKASEPTKKSIPRAKATAPKQVISWDITYLPTKTKGLYFYLYMFMDIYSRKIVGWEIHEVESGEYAKEILQKIMIAENMLLNPPVLHSDNGAAMKSIVLREKVNELNISLSYSRPRVSNDNPFSESLFGTLKMRPNYPEKPFDTIEDARKWTADFVHYYNFHHKHGGIKYVTPDQRHNGEDVEILAKRTLVYQEAKKRNPARWSGNIKDMTPVGDVHINKPEDALVKAEKA